MACISTALTLFLIRKFSFCRSGERRESVEKWTIYILFVTLGSFIKTFLNMVVTRETVMHKIVNPQMIAFRKNERHSFGISLNKYVRFQDSSGKLAKTSLQRKKQ